MWNGNYVILTSDYTLDTSRSQEIWELFPHQRYDDDLYLMLYEEEGLYFLVNGECLPYLLYQIDDECFPTYRKLMQTLCELEPYTIKKDGKPPSLIMAIREGITYCIYKYIFLPEKRFTIENYMIVPAHTAVQLI